MGRIRKEEIKGIFNDNLTLFKGMQEGFLNVMKAYDLGESVSLKLEENEITLRIGDACWFSELRQSGYGYEEEA